MNRPTLRFIADRLGVSTATVSLAMRDNKRISEPVRNRVKAALAQSGNVYSRSAASLRMSKTHRVGVLLNKVSDPFFSALLTSLEAALGEAGRTIFLCNTNESVDRQTDFIRKMSEYNADGIIVTPAIGSKLEHFSSKRTSQPALVFVSRTFRDSDFDYVINDDNEAGRLATHRLPEPGHRRIALAGGDSSRTTMLHRVIGLHRPCRRGFFRGHIWLALARLKGCPGGHVRPVP